MEKEGKMHEREKIKEAKYFYNKMLEEQGNKDNFRHNLSAFLSSARSVLQYALEVAKTKQGGNQWYGNRISAGYIIKFLKDKRDINIHAEPIQPQAHHKLTITHTLHLSDSLSITVTDKNGNIKSQYHSDEPEPKPKEPETPIVLETRYKFADWSGNEDIPTLCQIYVQELEDVVEDGIRKGFITG
jgi:hypothetical protein